MWRIRTLSAILSAMLLWFGTATARELRAPEKPEATTCGEFGTSVEFEPTPSHAARKALKAPRASLPETTLRRSV